MMMYQFMFHVIHFGGKTVSLFWPEMLKLLQISSCWKTLCLKCFACAQQFSSQSAWTLADTFVTPERYNTLLGRVGPAVNIKELQPTNLKELKVSLIKGWVNFLKKATIRWWNSCHDKSTLWSKPINILHDMAFFVALYACRSWQF